MSIDDFLDSELNSQKTKQRAAYGVDDRYDLYEVNDEKIQNDADSVIGLIAKDRLHDNGNGKSDLLTSKFTRVYMDDIDEVVNLCEKEKYYNQPTAPFCSGFLVGPDLVATAGHCIDKDKLSENNMTIDDVRFIFGFKMENKNAFNNKIDKEEIYKCKEIVNYKLEPNGSDWAIVRLDRKVTNHKIAKIHRQRIKDNQRVHVIGHPAGLPLKYAGGAWVRDNSPKEFFKANTDTYGGNSGSPIFNSETHEIEGILVRGVQDFKKNNKTNCAVTMVCPIVNQTRDCTGEDCARTEEFMEFIPQE